MFGPMRRGEASQIGDDAMNALIAVLNVFYRIGGVGVRPDRRVAGGKLQGRAHEVQRIADFMQQAGGHRAECAEPRVLDQRRFRLAQLLQALFQFGVGPVQVAFELRRAE